MKAEGSELHMQATSFSGKPNVKLPKGRDTALLMNLVYKVL